MHKYPRTSHIRGSRFQHGDHDMEAVPFEELVGKYLVIEEKMDGANSGISFDDDASLLLQSRGHYLRGGPRERHFDLLKSWAAMKRDDLYCALGSRYIMYGEWLFAKHTYFYDDLPHYFMEFDILDTQDNVFLDTPTRAYVLRGTGVVPVHVLGEGRFQKLDELRAFLGRSLFITEKRFSNLTVAALNAGVLPDDVYSHTDMDERMEGLYVKWEEHGEVKGRYKFVRESFTNTIMDQEEHWHDRPIVQNVLRPGALEAMFNAS